ncbi:MULTISPECIES: 1-aminocyclopropane-1-carboxylate deaminase/D-cysteine desulfhydrase [Pseudomonas]|jgi:1-aminocyclopropane-1-carboxylate deaminase|uniref:1-aminocyclopropane-1-carboxylate deaminase/D-cysteine desulfhydrase n=1 Tax=Pseudomonas TaxID=286 RepID=UPI0018E72BCD|nr:MULTISPECIES: 1-aminocyclopropane-1-carboxylate deaminase [Pseudomonas]MBJ2350323.1 1-aminocyclopropane-1-carboxylate deaminase [Pseudomonas canavaninivorans]MBL3545154.1 1-aminocyclopropane-1-carboxylate deaminase [Pseudomonas sp. HB05]
MLLHALDWHPQPRLEPLHLDWLADAGVEVAVLRLDRTDSLISGNKWFKLLHHLRGAHASGAEGIISLGGAYSNHLHALAAAGQRFGFPTVGLLRGHPQETPTVLDLKAFGMTLHWLGYEGYRRRHDADFWTPWQAQYPQLWPIPEGGSGLPGAQGCMIWETSVRDQLAGLGWSDYHGWWLACGTGTSLAGLVLAEAGRRPVHGVLAVPESHGVKQQVEGIVKEAGLGNPLYELIDGSRGGFARVDEGLTAFIETTAQIELEPLYTGKALLLLKARVEAGQFAAGTRLIFVHTGGLQGRRGFQ